MAMMGLRLGAMPRVVWTTTPKPRDLVRRLTKAKKGRVITTGSTFDNRANLPESFYEQIAQYEGTTLGRQELYGELIDAEEGGIIARSWFKMWPASKPLPKFEWIVMSLDTAFTEKTLDRRTHDPDASACTVWGVFWHEGVMKALLLDCWSEHLGLPDLLKRVRKELNVSYGDDADEPVIQPLLGPVRQTGAGRKPDMVLIEDKGSGISLRQSLEREGIQAYAYNPGRADKTSRLHVVSHLFQKGLFWLPESEKRPGKPKTWVEPMLEQVCAFRGDKSIKHDDYVDSVSQAARLLMDKGLISGVMRVNKSASDGYVAPKRIVNPYAV
jgi:predicted phage terminase large subunit-like protein